MSLIIKQEPHYSDYFMLAAKYALMHEKDLNNLEGVYENITYEEEENYEVYRYGIWSKPPHELELEDWDDDDYISYIFHKYWEPLRCDELGYPFGFILFDSTIVSHSLKYPLFEITYLLDEYDTVKGFPYELSSKMFDKIKKIKEDELKQSVFAFYVNMSLTWRELFINASDTRRWIHRALYLSNIENQKLDALKLIYPETYSEGDIK